MRKRTCAAPAFNCQFKLIKQLKSGIPIRGLVRVPLTKKDKEILKIKLRKTKFPAGD